MKSLFGILILTGLFASVGLAQSHEYSPLVEKTVNYKNWTLNDLKDNKPLDLRSAVAGKKLVKRHDLSKPQGVRGRNSDNMLLNKVLGWEPAVALEEGLRATYRWIEGELRKAGKIRGGS